jgi:hypothetical protein
MTHRPTPRWERALRKVGSNLVESIGAIFGSARAVSWRPPDPARGRESGLAHDEHPPAAQRQSDNAGRLPPRERRGRD